jgi:uncharacterized protein (DUF1501 family)
MLTRRELLSRSLKGTSLLALGSVVPEFVARTACAAEPNKDTILVVIELNGGNDGLNTVIPHGDDLYHKYRPTLRFTKDQVVRVTDHVGLHPAMRSLEPKLSELGIVLGVGYPNPDRSHFESMDIWQSADPRRKSNTGWLGRTGAQLHTGGIPMMHVGPSRLPLALQASGSGVISINHREPYRLDLGGGEARQVQARRALLAELAKPSEEDKDNPVLQFVQRRQVQTLSTLDRLQEFLRSRRDTGIQYRSIYGRQYPEKSLPIKLDMVAHLIQHDFGTRVFYVMRDDFDTHSNQAEPHRNLLGELADGISFMYETLKQSGNDQRVRVLTFSEFGRRVQENGSKGTDHGAASCLFVAGPGVKGGLIGEYPSLKDLDDGDLKYKIDFRRVYATLLDEWLGCNSETVLGAKFDHLPQLKTNG